MRTLGALIAIAGLTTTAHAACDKEHKALGEAEGPDVAASFEALAQCDAAEAGKAFLDVMKKTGEVDALTTLAITALDAGITEPVQAMAEHIPVSARDSVTQRIGTQCGDHEPTLQMLKGLHEAVKDRAYASWSAGLHACKEDTFTAWLETAVKAPPPHTFDDKYNTVLDVWAERKGPDALPALQTAAMGSLNGGPFQMVLDAMQRSVTPEGLNAKPSDADRSKLILALTSVAVTAAPEQASAIANRMMQVGDEAAAVALLPRIYPDAVQKGGGFLYGVASVESCDSETVLHWAEVSEPGKRWSVANTVQGTARGFKARLKCDSGEWEVRLTNGPVADSDAVEAWAEDFASELGEAKLRGEKTIVLD